MNRSWNRDEELTYAKRLVSHDLLTCEQLELYASRRRQALLFVAIQRDEQLRAWAREYPERARFCDLEDWQTLPSQPATRTTADESEATRVLRLANLRRIMTWWEVDREARIVLLEERLSRCKSLLSQRVTRDRPVVWVGTQSQIEKAAQEPRSPATLSPDFAICLTDDPSKLEDSQSLAVGVKTIRCLAFPGHRVLASPCRRANYHALTDIFQFDGEVDASEERRESAPILVTDLDNRFTLRLREKSERAFELRSTGCSCGRPFPLLQTRGKD